MFFSVSLGRFIFWLGIKSVDNPGCLAVLWYRDLSYRWFIIFFDKQGSFFVAFHGNWQCQFCLTILDGQKQSLWEMGSHYGYTDSAALAVFPEGLAQPFRKPSQELGPMWSMRRRKWTRPGARRCLLLTPVLKCSTIVLFGKSDVQSFSDSHTSSRPFRLWHGKQKDVCQIIY